MSATKAHNAIDEMQRTIDAVHISLQHAVDRNHDLSTKARQLEERRYGPLASAISRHTCYTREVDRSVPMDTYVTRLDLRSRALSFAMTDHSIFSAHDPIGMVNEGIETMIRMFTDDLRKQLRDEAFRIVNDAQKRRRY